MRKGRVRTLSIVIPALNEEGNIRATLASVVHGAQCHFDDYEIIVVNDGSTDRTLDLVTAEMNRNSRIKLISHEKPRGFGYSYNAGRKLARFEYCVMIHGDNAQEEATLERFFSYAGKADVISGYIENPEFRSRTRHLMSRCYTMLLNFVFGYNLRYYNSLPLHMRVWGRAINQF